MKSARAFVLVLVTAPNLKTGRALARAALQARLAACVNLVPSIESHYWWQGRLEKAAETMLVLKTTRARLARLEALVLERHPYDTPEILSVPLGEGTPRYLAWLTASLRAR